jgi:hypothetical protein
MKYRKQYTALLLITVFSSFLFYAFSSGVSGKTQLSGNDGCSCHAAASSPQVEVVIGGPEVLEPNQVAEYTVTITGGTLAGAGVNIAASAGTLVIGEGLSLLAGELTHTSPKASSGGAVIFNFSFIAPETGTAVLYATGNSINLNGAVTGDSWNFSLPKTITISPFVSVKDEIITRTFRLAQNFPNPFNPSTAIFYEIPNDVSGELVSLKIYDITGKERAELVNEIKSAGVYKVDFNASGLASGVYIYKITAGKYSATRKMSLLK